MIEHYNAFISYKHADADIKVAEAVQHSLEHYHIPGKIRKKNGIKRIERIFRDKEELPITSDLSENISFALEHSDYLIVICSTNTKQSVWVPREIEFFLRNHTKQQILTVLVDGEPQDVIPEILLHEDKVITDENGNQRTIQVPLEPLSCDYRTSIKKANKDEIPRLASALIGCSYDELMNRQRQYKMKRMVISFSIIMALVLSFTAQMIYGRIKIKQNYLDSLRNQSKYLASESEYYLENEQRITAIKLALAALPEDKHDERPVTAEAIRAITSSTLAYKSLAGNNISAAWNYQMPNKITDFVISPDDSYLAATDFANNVYVWDISSHESILQLNQINDLIYGIRFISDDKILIWSDTDVHLYDLNNGSQIWTYTIDDDSFRPNECIVDADENIYLSTFNSSLVLLDSSNGQLIDKYTLKNNNGENYINYSDFCLSPDKSTLAYAGNYSIDTYIVCTFNLKTKTEHVSEGRNSRIKALSWADNSHIMVAYSENEAESNASFMENSYLSTDHTYVQCLDAANLKELWNYDFTSNEVNIYNKFITLPNTNSVAFCNGNMAGIFDYSKGELLYNHNVNASIVDISDRDGDGWPIYITAEGGLALPSPSNGTDALTLTKLFTDEIEKVIVNNGVYVHQSGSKEIIYYGLYVSDSEWTSVDENLVLNNIWDTFYMDYNYLSIITDEDNIATLTLIQPETDEVNQIPLGTGDTMANQYKTLGIRDNKLYISYSDYSKGTLITIDLSNMNRAEIEIPDSYIPSADSCSLQTGKLAYYIEKKNKYYVALYDLDTKQTSTYPLPDDYYPGFLAPFYIEKTGKIFITSDYDCIIDTKTGNVKKIESTDNYTDTSSYAISKSGKGIAISDNIIINILNDNAETKLTITCPGVDVLGMDFYKNPSTDESELFVVYSNGKLYRYNLKDGSLIGSSDISTYSNGYYTASFYVDYDSKLLYIQMGMLTDIIDLDSMIETTCIENCLGYNIPTDRFYTISYTKSGENNIGYFKHYTLYELIQKGRDIIQESELTDEEKAEYGIK